MLPNLLLATRQHAFVDFSTEIQMIKEIFDKVPCFFVYLRNTHIYQIRDMYLLGTRIQIMQTHKFYQIQNAEKGETLRLDQKI